MHNNISPIDPTAETTSEIVLVTPDVATQWLQGNVRNRNLRQPTVDQYAESMSEGNWSISDSAICFAPNGRLLNGQHRLHAVVKSGRSVRMLIMRGVPESAMGNMDVGAKRTIADHLRFRGEANAALLGSIAKCAWLIQTGRIYGDTARQKVTNKDLEDFIADRGDLRAAAAFATHYKPYVDLTPTSIGVTYWLVPNKSEFARFMDSLASGVGLEAGSPILALNSRLRQLRNNRAKTSRREEISLLIKAWNYWLAGKKVKTISLPGSGERIPQPR